MPNFGIIEPGEKPDLKSANDATADAQQYMRDRDEAAKKERVLPAPLASPKVDALAQHNFKAGANWAIKYLMDKAMQRQKEATLTGSNTPT